MFRRIPEGNSVLGGSAVSTLSQAQEMMNRRLRIQSGFLEGWYVIAIEVEDNKEANENVQV